MNASNTAGRVITLLGQRGWLLATAESCTGGLLGAAITGVPGASSVYMGGWITYANEAKSRDLGVAPGLLNPPGPGAVSREVAEAMALGAQRASGADACISVTGIAGPDGGTPTKPVGTVWLGLALRGRAETRLLQLSGDREQIRRGAVEGALVWLAEALQAPA
jgi:PncC family amidohydrolase